MVIATTNKVAKMPLRLKKFTFISCYLKSMSWLAVTIFRGLISSVQHDKTPCVTEALAQEVNGLHHVNQRHIPAARHWCVSEPIEWPLVDFQCGEKTKK